MTEEQIRQIVKEVLIEVLSDEENLSQLIIALEHQIMDLQSKIDDELQSIDRKLESMNRGY